ncbi:hypothetical protein M0802_007183 [Mischocyttarus mexicanus]|nr:hypothetical protein M0802_007183 [Mischocyttarus mexicanus]
MESEVRVSWRRYTKKRRKKERKEVGLSWTTEPCQVGFVVTVPTSTLQRVLQQKQAGRFHGMSPRCTRWEIVLGASS